MRSNVCVNEMALFGPFAAFVKGKTLFHSDGEKRGLPTRGDSGPIRYGCAAHDIHGFTEGLVSFRTVWCAIVAGDICSESSDCLGSPQWQAPLEIMCFSPVFL